MLLYVKEIVDYKIGDNTPFENVAKSMGWTQTIDESQIEQAYDGSWWLVGFAPEKTVEQKQVEVRSVRNQYLEQTDKYLSVSDFPIDEDTKEQYRLYRTYLRDYPETEDWYESSPLPFEQWNELPGISGELEQIIDSGD